MKSPALAGLAVQLVVLLPVCLVLLGFNKVWAWSFGLGAVIFILPNFYFALYAFRFHGARHAHWIAKSFKWGESGKFALVAVGFALVFRFISPLNAPLLFAGFCSMIVLQWWIAHRLPGRWLKRLGRS